MLLSLSSDFRDKVEIRKLTQNMISRFGKKEYVIAMIGSSKEQELVLYWKDKDRVAYFVGNVNEKNTENLETGKVFVENSDRIPRQHQLLYIMQCLFDLESGNFENRAVDLNGLVESLKRTTETICNKLDSITLHDKDRK